MTEKTMWRVDDRCTNCDVARQFAPDLVEEVDGRSAGGAPAVDRRRPESRCATAAFACPHPVDPASRLAGSIRTSTRSRWRWTTRVFHCGHNSRPTAGANSYLLRRPTGNVMVDTPRWSAELADRYERLGPVTEVLLTHRDHVAHGRQYADRFGARLWIHEGDLDSPARRRPGHSRTGPGRDRAGAGRASAAWTHRGQRALPLRRHLLLHRRLVLLVARRERPLGRGERHLLLDPRARRVAGQDRATDPVRMGAARPRRPDAPIGAERWRSGWPRWRPGRRPSRRSRSTSPRCAGECASVCSPKRREGPGLVGLGIRKVTRHASASTAPAGNRICLSGGARGRVSRFANLLRKEEVNLSWIANGGP